MSEKTERQIENGSDTEGDRKVVIDFQLLLEQFSHGSQDHSDKAPEPESIKKSEDR